jgi:isopenicillin N synthase-like dioxygenase
VGYALHDSCVNVGFFYIKNAGVPEDLRQRALHLAEQFFALPEVGCREEGKTDKEPLRYGLTQTGGLLRDGTQHAGRTTTIIDMMMY